MAERQGMKNMTDWIGSGYLTTLERFPERPALAINGKTLSYRALASRAGALLTAMGPGEADEPLLTAVFTMRSVAAYAGLLAVLSRGHGYVPLNPKFPANRLGYMLSHAGCRTLIVDSGAEAGLRELLDEVGYALRIVFADRTDVTDIIEEYPGHDLRAGLREETATLSAPPDMSSDDIAYILFTSGSTGTPKGVAVSHGNVAHFLHAMQARYSFDATDRFSQMFDLVFDLSVFDLFMAWKVGGCVCCPTPGELMLPADFIRESGITVWFSVPSVAVLLRRLRQLEPDTFPDLKFSFFCGEALPIEAAGAWASAASNSIVENLYGPTEVTLACTAYRWQGPPSCTKSETGIVPIGTALPGLSATVVDENLREVAPGAQGELLMAGPQVTLGYWRDEEKTRAVFVINPANGERAYRTGDLVRRPDDSSGALLYLGRLDHQIKLHGHRIELGEIEAILKVASGASRVVAAGWPINLEGGVGGIVAFLECETTDSAALNKIAQRNLPNYMIPNKLYAIPHFPLTPNGKVDRKALLAQLSSSTKT